MDTIQNKETRKYVITAPIEFLDEFEKIFLAALRDNNQGASFVIEDDKTETKEDFLIH